MAVPPVLTGGHHEEVRKWRLKESLRRTWRKRPDLLEDRPLTKEEAKLLAEVSHDESQQALAAEERDPVVAPPEDDQIKRPA
jgi:tRNA (guanine37-N1)-methyltransferase